MSVGVERCGVPFSEHPLKLLGGVADGFEGGEGAVEFGEYPQPFQEVGKKTIGDDEEVDVTASPLAVGRARAVQYDGLRLQVLHDPSHVACGFVVISCGRGWARPLGRRIAANLFI